MGVTLRPADGGDVADLLAMLAQPEVATWWGAHDAEEVRAELDGSFVILLDDAFAGWLQAHEETDPQFPSVGFDIALLPRLHGRGHGREALRLAVARFAARGHHRFTIDPAVGNEQAIRCYRAAGFEPVGVLRAYERAPDGTWRDGLLMDLVLTPDGPSPAAS